MEFKKKNRKLVSFIVESLPLSLVLGNLTGLPSPPTVDSGSAILTRFLSPDPQSPARMGRVISFSTTTTLLEGFDD